jgi:PAS domain S-box-containing protein
LPLTKILILSQHNLPQMTKQALHAGANGYVVKTAISTELVSALNRLDLEDIDRVGKFMGLDENVDVQEIIQRSRVFEQALHETSERLRLAQQVARVGTFEFNVKTGVNRWTPELESLYGLQPGEFAGTQTAWEQMIHPDDRQATINKLDTAAHGPGFESEWRVVWPDGSVHWLLGRAFLFKDDAGRPERWIGVNIDITERKRAEEENKKLLRLLDLTFDAIVIRDNKDQVRYWNHGAQEIYGWTANEAFGNVTHTLLKTTFPEPVENIFAALKKAGRWQGQLTHYSKSGERLTVLSRWALLQDWESGKQWVLETNTEITRKPSDASQHVKNHSEFPIKALIVREGSG